MRAWISTAVVGGALTCVAATLPGLWVLVGTVVMGVILALRPGTDHRHLITMLCAVSVGLTAVDYLAWRAVVANWQGWEIAAPLLAAEVFGALHTFGLQYTIWPSTEAELRRCDDPARRPIFILIPTVNEGPAVLTPTIRGAVGARRRFLGAFPNAEVTVVVCNDSRAAGNENWRDVEDLAARLGVACVTRTVPDGNKAGNLEHARQQVKATGEALVSIFDADQVANPDFLLKTVPPFADQSVGWVQTGQYYRNVDEPVARWANDQQALFYRVLCPGKAAQNAAFICGTNVVIRATALDEIGGFPQDSVTEDFAASIRLHPRWRSVYLSNVLALGLGPMDLPAFLKQQHRWARGTIGVLRSHWRAIFLPRRDGLTLEQRVQYGLACTHYVCGLRDLIYVVSPLAFLVTGVPAVRGATLGLFLWHFAPYWIASQAAFWFAARGQTGIRGVIMGFGSFPVLIRALFAVLLGRHASFMVTSKQRRPGRSWRHLAIYATALLACCVGILLPLGRHQLRSESVAISVLWIVYDIALLASFLWLGIVDLRKSWVASGARSRGRLGFLCLRVSPSTKAMRWVLTVWTALVLSWCAALAVVTLADAMHGSTSLAGAALSFIYELALFTCFLWVRRWRTGGTRTAAWDERPGVRRRLAGNDSRRWQRWASSLAGLAVDSRHQPRVLAERLSPSRRALRPTVGLATAVLLGTGIVPWLSFPISPDHVRLTADRQPGQSPSLGLSLPHEILATRPNELRSRLCLPFGVIGRTQDIGDSFDVEWANRLSAENQQPWVVLQFANSSGNGKPPLEASLPAIANGVQDARIRRWAEEIHSYRRLVYLTILLHVDRNWSTSSAVANGGIPQDVPKAWRHVQSIFKSAGDTNVAWVWSPADPAHDQEYAPPESTIDVVLQSLIRYPGTPWPDPASVLHSVGHRHPTKPLFLEVSGEGPPLEKAAWLEQVGSAVAADSQVYAMLYHEGSPDLHATPAENARWSLESDPDTRAAVLSWQSLVPAMKLTCQSAPGSSVATKGA